MAKPQDRSRSVTLQQDADSKSTRSPNKQPPTEPKIPAPSITESLEMPAGYKAPKIEVKSNELPVSLWTSDGKMTMLLAGMKRKSSPLSKVPGQDGPAWKATVMAMQKNTEQSRRQRRYLLIGAVAAGLILLAVVIPIAIIFSKPNKTPAPSTVTSVRTAPVSSANASIAGGTTSGANWTIETNSTTVETGTDSNTTTVTITTTSTDTATSNATIDQSTT